MSKTSSAGRVKLNIEKNLINCDHHISSTANANFIITLSLLLHHLISTSSIITGKGAERKKGTFGKKKRIQPVLCAIRGSVVPDTETGGE